MIISCIAVLHSASVSNVGMSFVMLRVKQHLSLEVAIRKFFNKDYGKYQGLCLANSVNAAANDSENS